MQIYTQALVQFLLKNGPTDRRAPKRNRPQIVYIIPSARREVKLRDEKVAGYLATGARLDVHTFMEHQSAKKEPGQPDADHASYKTSREPEHASDEMPFAQPREMHFKRARILPLRAPADPPNYLLFVTFVALGHGPLIAAALIGWDTTHSLIWRAAKRTGS